MGREKIRIIPLGGLGEIGKNILVLEYQDKILVIDAGLMFPEEEMLGIDLVLPDYSYLKENARKILGLILTHGHEDHVGALPYLLKEINVPVFGTRLTLGLVKVKLMEFGLTNVTLKEVKPGEKLLSLGPFKIDFLRVNHSIPDGVGLAIQTPLGTIIHSGDFKFDQTPINGQKTDYGKFAQYGNKGVLLLLSDSTNSEVPGVTLPEKVVGETLTEIITSAKGRVIVVSFASHLHRIQQVFDVASKSSRKVAISGRSMRENIAIASELGFLKFSKDILVDIYKIDQFNEEKLVILCTGSQGEPLSALSRMATGEHRQIEIKSGDTVIIAATPIPGNEKSVSRIIDRLFRCGADVFYESVSGVHVSGHGGQEELKLMLNLTKPKYFIPIHGEYRHLKHHADLALQVGLPQENIFILENGDVFELSQSGAIKKKPIRAGIVYVDGLSVGDVGEVVLRDRQQLSQDGILIVVVGIDTKSGEILSGPDLISRGFVYTRQSKDLLAEAKEKVIARIEKSAKEKALEWPVLKSEIRDILTHFFYQKTKRHPMILPIVVEI